MSETCIDHNQEIHVYFVDYEKAFDRVDWSKLLKVLKDIGVNWRDRWLIIIIIIVALYTGQRAVVRLKHGPMSEAGIGCGTRKGCSLSPILFNIYAETMI